MFSIKGVADNAAGTIVGAVILGAGGAAVSTLSGSSLTEIALAGVSLFALGLLVLIAMAVRARREGAHSDLLVEQRQTNGDALRLVGRTEDERAVLVLAGRVVEFDANGYEYFAGREDGERLRVSRAVAAGRTSRFSEFMLRSIVKGDRPADEDIYEERSRGEGTRFWTRSEIRADEASAKSSADVWGWYDGHYRRMKISLVEAESLLSEAKELLRPEQSPAVHQLGDLAAGAVAFARMATVDEWLAKLATFGQRRRP